MSERVYMKAVPGYPLEDDDCLELHHKIYGLKQWPRAYYLLCQRVYTEIGLTQLKECCFILKECCFILALRVLVFTQLVGTQSQF